MFKKAFIILVWDLNILKFSCLFFFIKAKKTLKIKGPSFSDDPGVGFAILFYEKYSQRM